MHGKRVVHPHHPAVKRFVMKSVQAQAVRGLRRFSMSLAQGVMWLATSRSRIRIPVTQQRNSYADRMRRRKKLWLTRTRTTASRSRPSTGRSRVSISATSSRGLPNRSASRRSLSKARASGRAMKSATRLPPPPSSRVHYRERRAPGVQGQAAKV